MSGHYDFKILHDHDFIQGTLDNIPPKDNDKDSVSRTIGIDSSSGTITSLPTGFKVNGLSADIHDDEAPSTPENLRLGAAGSKSASFNWDKATDNFGVYGYKVRYWLQGEEASVSESFSKTNSIALNSLKSSSDYLMEVYSIDIADNISEASHVITFRTGEPLPDPGDWDLRRAPFVDYTAWPTPQIAEYSSASGVDAYFLGFLVAKPGGDKQIYWGGQSVMVDSNIPDESFSGNATISDYGKKDIRLFRNMGGEVILSFGGASNVPVEEEETDITKIVALYSAIIKNYGIRHIDFDFEGAFIHNQEAQDRHVAAMAQLLQQFFYVQISYTLPVDGAPGSLEGFNEGGVNLLKKLADNGIQPSLINGMLMEFGQSSSPDAFQCCVSGLNGMHKQIASVFTDWSSNKIWRRMGACPMFGRHLNGKIFTLDDQYKLAAFASEKNLGCLSGWDATRDRNQGFLQECNNLQGQDLAKCTYVSQQPYEFARIISTYQPVSFTSQSVNFQSVNLMTSTKSVK